MSCTYYNGISPLFLILLTSLLYCLPPQLEYGLPEDTDLGLPYSHQFPNTKYSSCYRGSVNICWINGWTLKQKLCFLRFQKCPRSYSLIYKQITNQRWNNFFKSNKVIQANNVWMPHYIIFPHLSNRRISPLLRIQNMPHWSLYPQKLAIMLKPLESQFASRVRVVL